MSSQSTAALGSVPAAVAVPGSQLLGNAAVPAAAGMAAALFLVADRSESNRWTMVTGSLGALVFALGLAALIGYLAQIEPAYGWEYLTRMAVHTSGGFMVLGAGLSLLVRRFAGSFRSTRGRAPGAGLTVRTDVAARNVRLTVTAWPQPSFARDLQSRLAEVFWPKGFLNAH